VNYDAEVPELPYKCSDLGCPCQGEPRLNDLDQRVSFSWTQEEYRAMIHQDGALIDVIRGHDNVDVVRQVHENYPFAQS